VTTRPVLAGHRLMAVREAHTYGIEPVWASCTCGFETAPGTQAEVAVAFDEHTVAVGAGLVIAPWRETS